MTFTHALATDNYGSSKFIVSANIYEGTHTTIAAALTSASSGDSIFIRPGTYVENISLKAGVNLTAYVCDANEPNVIISGTCTGTFTGSATLSGIRLQTNSAPFLTVSGSNATIINLEYCYLNALNNTGISYSSSNSSSQININHSRGDIGTTGIAMFAATSTGSINFLYSVWGNSGLTTTASTANPTGLSLNWTIVYNSISVTASSGSMNFSQINSQNNTSFTTATSGTYNLTSCFFGSGTSSAISIGASTTVTVSESSFTTSNANPITGAGTLTYGPSTFSSLPTLNTTTINDTFYLGRENTYLPALSFGGSTTGITYTTQTGKFWRIGALVFYMIDLTLSNKGAQVGSAAITLPFTSAADSSNYINNLWVLGGASAFPASSTTLFSYLDASSNSLSLWGLGTAAQAPLTNTQFTNTTSVRSTGFYWTA